jgi:uncharacterized membrane protein YfhO
MSTMHLYDFLAAAEREAHYQIRFFFRPVALLWTGMHQPNMLAVFNQVFNYRKN